MARRKKLFQVMCGIIIGVLLSQFCHKNLQKNCAIVSYHEPSPGHQNLLFVGVMTAEQYLEGRAKAVFKTWGHRVPGKILFFSSENSTSDSVPLVALDGVDDGYPPQKKSFLMLKYMYENFIDHYEWFLRADDDLYVRLDELEKLLRSVDSRKPWFIGQTGRGNTEEIGMLSLESDENFCMGGPGVIFSRETLRRMAPFIEECLGDLYTTHEDVELGRCVRRFAGVSCTWSYEMQVIFYHNQSGQAAFSGDLKQKEVHRAITLHPVKKPSYMHRLDKYFKALKIQTNQQETINLFRDLATSMKQLHYGIQNLHNVNLTTSVRLFEEKRGNKNYLGDISLLGLPQNLNRFNPRDLSEVIDWELIVKSLFSYTDLNPRKRIGTSMKEGFNDIVREIMELINLFSKQRGRIIDFKEILYGYWRLNPLSGVDLILDLLLVYRKYRGHKMTVQVRRHAYVQQTFTGIMIREVKCEKKAEKIVEKIISVLPIFGEKSPEKIFFIMPLSGRYSTFKRFLENYRTVCLQKNENTHLTIVLYPTSEYSQSKTLIENFQQEFSMKITVIENNETFSRARALEKGSQLFSNNSLLLFIDVDIIFDSSTLQRIRSNTVINKTVYFPIVYSLYNPKSTNRSLPQSYDVTIINEDNGFWRQFGFGIASLYKSDYLNLGGFDLGINGWGSEDVSFYDHVIKSNLKIVRSVDVGLIHVYHHVDCDINLDSVQQNMCLGTQASMLGSLRQLERLYKHKYL